MRFLVTGANGDIAEAVAKVLNKTFPDSVIHGSDSSGLWPAKFYFKKVYKIPHASSYKYLDYIDSIKNRYNLIIPTTEKEIFKLSSSKINLNKVLINSKYMSNFFLKIPKSKNLTKKNIFIKYK